jgi:hypothetical protein
MRIQIMSHITQNTMHLNYEQRSVNAVYSVYVSFNVRVSIQLVYILTAVLQDD